MNVCAAASMLRIPSLRVRQLLILTFYLKMCQTHNRPRAECQPMVNTEISNKLIYTLVSFCLPGVLVLVKPVKAISKDAQTSSSQAAELLSLQGISSFNIY